MVALTSSNSYDIFWHARNLQISKTILFILQVHNQPQVITGRAHHSVLLYRGDVVVLVRRHAEVADALRVYWVHEELLVLLDAVRD